jgi:hypothetical protein
MPFAFLFFPKPEKAYEFNEIKNCEAKERDKVSDPRE